MLCGTCREELYCQKDSRCYLCNKITKQQQVCKSCRSRSKLRRVWWLDTYQHVTKALIKEMKFHRKRAYAREFGEILAITHSHHPSDTVVVPIPTASSRVRRRGFDQAAVIAQEFAAHKHLPYAPLLQCLHQNDQIGKTKIERHKQMEQSFRVSSGVSVENATILLIDDVLTTGATLEAAARMLRKAGAKHVDAAVIARAI